MIRPLSDRGVGTAASFVSQRFRLPSVVGSEVLRISAHGLYRCFINGKRVGDDLLTPGWTAYDKRLSFQTYAVADHLLPGDNRIEIWLADGWFRSQMMWQPVAILNTWGEHIAAIAEIRNGEGALLVATDPTWRSGLLPVLKSGIYFGEVYDARRERLVESAGTAAIAFDPSVLVRQEARPVRDLSALDPVRSWPVSRRSTIHDFGQNASGTVAFSVRGKAGARIVVEHAEILTAGGDLDNANFRSAESRVEYVLKGEGEEHYRPFFTFQGFRYARVTIRGRAEVTAIRFVPFSSLGEPAGELVTGHPLVNRLVENTLWSQWSNFIEVPTDCPQRDERLGWTGDAQVFAGAACHLFDCHAFLAKWLRDVMADQRADGAIPHVVPDPTRLHPEHLPNFAGSTGWGDAITVVPWTLYLQYGDRAILEEALPAMVRWVDFVHGISDGPIVRPPPGWHDRGFTFGDWLQPAGTADHPLPTIGTDAAATIYLFISATLTAKAAAVVGAGDVAGRMTALAETVRAAFQRTFMEPSGRLIYDDQTSYALAILHDLIPPGLLPRTIACFKASIARAGGRIGTGFIGTPALLPALVKAGEADLAAAVLLQEEVPGWLYQVRMGATTIWERWDAMGPDGTPYEPSMNSYNHYAYGAVCQWLFEAAAGIRPDETEPGYRHILLEPVVIPALSPLKARRDTVAGRIGVDWSVEGDLVRYRAEVPPGARATLVPGPGTRDVMLAGIPLSGDADPAGLRIRLGPGVHEATFRLVR